MRAGGRTVTYQQLDEMSNALAVVLSRNQVAKGARMAVWLNKSAEAVAGIHGALRAGAAYVPVDPTAPPRRAAQVIADCRPACLLTTPDRAEALSRENCGRIRTELVVLVGQPGNEAPAGPAVLTWDEVMSHRHESPRPRARTARDDLAYILYTSGSTGLPKGVMLTHGNARAFVDWAVDEFRLRCDDVLASHAPFHFDLSVFDIFGAAAACACVSLIPESLAGLGYGLIRFATREGVSIWYSVPGALRRMVAADKEGLLADSRLRVIAFAGEVYHLAHLRALRAAIPRRAALYNLYGPTETNVCTYHRVLDSDITDSLLPTPPIGLPCPYATAVITDGDAVVQGKDGEILGELCIGGDSVMAGYWGDAVRTEQKMVRAIGTERNYYRTGDIVRRDAAGRYFFIGRSDDMVKIRGYRVELGEVETVLSRHPEVAEAGCVAGQDDDGEARLIAFVALTPASAADESSLQRYCREFLPLYMVPDEIVLVQELMRTSTGKIDRRAMSLMARKAATR